MTTISDLRSATTAVETKRAGILCTVDGEMVEKEGYEERKNLGTRVGPGSIWERPGRLAMLLAMLS